MVGPNGAGAHGRLSFRAQVQIQQAIHLEASSGILGSRKTAKVDRNLKCFQTVSRRLIVRGVCRFLVSSCGFKTQSLLGSAGTGVVLTSLGLMIEASGGLMKE